MHISLDSAIGQQRRLNQVGETINSIAAPAAAYSLRSLTGGDPKVVRVRRESDNTERDFTASGVSSGAMVDFVNAQTVKPLDTRALNSGGSGERDGDFQIASAAYSLRSLGDRQATVAATGDTVTAANGKYVVQVRRSRDNTIKSFTADEVSDGTLVSFVTDPSTGWNTQPTWNTITGSGVIRSQSSTASTSTLTFFAYGTSHTISDSSRPSHIVANEGDVVDINLTISNIQGAASIEIRAAGTDTALASSSTISNGTVGASFTVDSNANGGAHIVFSSLETPSDFSDGTITINSVTVTGKTGFVRTWYDQSVTDQGGGTATGNHVTQSTATKQPRVVIDGSLVVRATKPSIDFGGNNFLERETYTQGTLSQPNTFFSVAELDAYADENRKVYDSHLNTSRNMLQLSTAGNGQFAHFAGTVVATGEDADADRHLFTSLLNGASSSLRIDGTEKTTANPSTTAMTGIVIGANHDTVQNFWDGDIQELIIFNSDQTANIGAFEGNISDQYGITGVPTGANTVNGFVETWYDQSGNGNDVVQATASQQPKIVSSGSLITAGVTFDEANSTELVATDPVITAAAAGTYSTFSVQTISNTESGYLYGNASPTDGSSLYASSSTYIVSNKNSATGFDSISKGASEQLLSAVYNNNDAVMQVDGGGSTSDGSTYNFSAGTSNFRMGNRASGTSTGTKLTGAIREVVVYNSDQTANRTALETNINSHYSIF